MKKSKSVVSFKELTEEIPDSSTHFDLKFELAEKPEESVLDSTITLEEPKIGNLLPGFGLPVISLVEEAQLLEKDKALALLVGELEDRQEEEEMLQEELDRSAASNRAMVHVVGEYEKTIEQLVQEKARQRTVLIAQAEEKKEEVTQVLSEIEDVKRASKDLTKKYSRTKEVISGYVATEAELKGEVESLVGRVSERFSSQIRVLKSVSQVRKSGERFELLKADAERQLEEANTRLGEVKVENYKNRHSLMPQKGLNIAIYIQVKKSKASELAKLSIMLRKAQMQVVSLEKEKEQKEAENAELTKICDDLISKLD